MAVLLWEFANGQALSGEPQHYSVLWQKTWGFQHCWHVHVYKHPLANGKGCRCFRIASCVWWRRHEALCAMNLFIEAALIPFRAGSHLFIKIFIANLFNLKMNSGILKKEPNSHSFNTDVWQELEMCQLSWPAAWGAWPSRFIFLLF